MTTAGSCTVIDGSDSPWGDSTYKLYSTNKDPEDHYLHFDGKSNSLKADGDGMNNANFKIHEAVDNQQETIVILEHKESGKVMAINTQNDKVTLENPPVVLDDFIKRAGTDTSHPEILFHKKWWRPGRKWFYLKSLLDGPDRFVKFENDGTPTGTTAKTKASLFRADRVENST